MEDLEKQKGHTSVTLEDQALSHDGNIQSQTNEAFIVSFDAQSRKDPKTWSRAMKWSITAAMSAMCFNRILVSTIMAPAITTIAADLSMTSTESVMALSIYLLATAFGPLFIGPLSEIYGRKPIIHSTNLWFLLWNLICGFATSKELLIASRFFAGFGASAVYTIGYGVLGDIWEAEDRGRSLTWYLLVPLLGAAIGPTIGGFITEYVSWRWMFYSTSILQAVLSLTSVPLIRETYAPLLLTQKASRLRLSTSDNRYHAPTDLDLDLDFNNNLLTRSPLQKLQYSLSRPLRLLLFHPIIQIQALLSSLNYGLLYFAITTFSSLFVDAYGESIATSGFHYFALCLGEILGAQLCGPVMDWSYRRIKEKAIAAAAAAAASAEARTESISDSAPIAPGSGETRATTQPNTHAKEEIQVPPESRLPLSFPGALLTPLGLLLYGWSAQHRLPWIIVDLGGLILTLGTQVFGMPLQAYVMDFYPEYVSSASAATQFVRSLTAFGVPLLAPVIYGVRNGSGQGGYEGSGTADLWYGWGNTLLAGIAAVLGIGGLGVVWRWGGGLRRREREGGRGRRI